MAKISIASVDEAPKVGLPAGLQGAATAHAVFGRPQDPIHLHACELASGGTLRIGPREVDTLVYVWKGQVAAGAQPLTASSSVVVERGAVVEIRGVDPQSTLLTFASARGPLAERAGGHVHLMPADRVPRGQLPNTNGVGGALHADGGCATCEVWLHENSLPGREDSGIPPGGVHSHEEDEVIFVLRGEMHLGTQVLKPGGAVAIGKDAFYGFGIGREGLTFINFRPARPGVIKFKQGGTLDEVAMWRDNLGTPKYLEAVAV